MAIKIKRKVDKPEEEATPVVPDDAILRATRDSADIIDDNKYLLGAIVLAVFVGFIVFSQVKKAGHATHVENANELFYAASHVSAEVNTEDSTFATVEERNARFLENSQVVASDHAGTALGDYATLLVAAGEVGSGNAEAAVGHYNTFLAGHSGPESAVAQVGRAVAQAEAGELADAVAALTELEASNETYGFAAAYQRTLLVDAYGAPADALQEYRNLADNYADDLSLGGVDNRIAQLEIALGVDEEPEVEAAEPATDDE